MSSDDDNDDNDANRLGSRCISGGKSVSILPTTGVCLVSFQILLSQGPLFAGGQSMYICRDGLGMR